MLSPYTLNLIKQMSYVVSEKLVPNCNKISSLLQKTEILPALEDDITNNAQNIQFKHRLKP